MSPIVLAALLTITGCQSLPLPDQDTQGDGKAIHDSGVTQIRDIDTGEAYHVLCDSCAKPSPKTRYRAPAPVSLIVETPESVQPKSGPVVVQEPTQASPPESESKPQSYVLKRTVPFAFGLSSLGSQGHKVMHAILNEATSAKHVHIRGYTDIIGTIPGNKRMAMSRAIEIQTHLIKGGIPHDKLSTSYCIDCFADSNETREGRAANRRAVVEMDSMPGIVQESSLPVAQ